MELRDKVMVVTGAGGGIGRQLALQLIARGTRVAAVDIRQENLDKTASLAAAGAHTAQYMLDEDGDGVQDVAAAPGDAATPVISVTIAPADPFNNAAILLEVVMTASWYGAAGNRTVTIESLVANRSGYQS